MKRIVLIIMVFMGAGLAMPTMTNKAYGQRTKLSSFPFVTTDTNLSVVVVSDSGGIYKDKRVGSAAFITYLVSELAPVLTLDNALANGPVTGRTAVWTDGADNTVMVGPGYVFIEDASSVWGDTIRAAYTGAGHKIAIQNNNHVNDTVPMKTYVDSAVAAGSIGSLNAVLTVGHTTTLTAKFCSGTDTVLITPSSIEIYNTTGGIAAPMFKAGSNGSGTAMSLGSYGGVGYANVRYANTNLANDDWIKNNGGGITDTFLMESDTSSKVITKWRAYKAIDSGLASIYNSASSWSSGITSTSTITVLTYTVTTAGNYEVSAFFNLRAATLGYQGAIGYTYTYRGGGTVTDYFWTLDGSPSPNASFTLVGSYPLIPVTIPCAASSVIEIFISGNSTGTTQWDLSANIKNQ